MMKITRAVVLFCLLTIVEMSSASLHNEPNAEFRFLRQEIGFLRDENNNQNLEIAQLKKKMEFKDNSGLNTEKIKELINQSIEKHLAAAHDKESPSGTISRRKKRPAQLIPLQNHNQRLVNVTVSKPFYGPATNCSELSKLGYTLNGFYQVKPKSLSTANTTDDITKLDTVYCSFKQPEGTVNRSANLEKRIIEVDHLKNMKAGSKAHRGVYFYAIKNKTRPSLQKLRMVDIGFDYILVNSGFQFKSGFVTVPIPKSGVYQFVYTAVMNTVEGTVSNVILAQANVRIAQSRSLNSGNVVVEATLKANLGDKIHVRSEIGNGTSIQWASFSGSLLEEL